MRLLLARILTVSSSSNREETTAENSGKFALIYKAHKFKATTK